VLSSNEYELPPLQVVAAAENFVEYKQLLEQLFDNVVVRT
jgi:hypothetical protein